MQQLDFLRRYPVKIYYNHPSISAFKSGGNIDCVVYPERVDSLEYCIKALNERGQSFKLVGNCTNILIKDKGYKGIIISTKYITGSYVEEDRLYAYSGEKLSKVFMLAKNNNLSGFERLKDIPGTIGGAVCMNAGAFSMEIMDIVEYIDVYEDEYKRIYKKDIEYSYRNTQFKNSNTYILGVMFKLEKKDIFYIDYWAKKCEKERKQSQPNAISLGSVFKKCNGISAGEYIEKVGLKGYSHGGAQISSKHANFIINKGNAKSRDFLYLSDLILTQVDNKFNVSLEYEIEIL